VQAAALSNATQGSWTPNGIAARVAALASARAKSPPEAAVVAPTGPSAVVASGALSGPRTAKGTPPSGPASSGTPDLTSSGLGAIKLAPLAIKVPAVIPPVATTPPTSSQPISPPLAMPKSSSRLRVTEVAPPPEVAPTTLVDVAAIPAAIDDPELAERMEFDSSPAIALSMPDSEASTPTRAPSVLYDVPARPERARARTVADAFAGGDRPHRASANIFDGTRRAGPLPARPEPEEAPAAAAWPWAASTRKRRATTKVPVRKRRPPTNDDV
jgi:hypothetical protein